MIPETAIGAGKRYRKNKNAHLQKHAEQQKNKRIINFAFLFFFVLCNRFFTTKYIPIIIMISFVQSHKLCQSRLLAVQIHIDQHNCSLNSIKYL